METALLNQFNNLSINPTYNVLHTSDNESIQSRYTFFSSIPNGMDLIYEEQASTPPNGMNLIYNDQDFLTDADSSREAFLYSHDDSIEGEDDYDEADESYISSSNFDTTINDPELLNVLNELSQEPSDHIISFQKFYYFNTCSYEVPHHGNHMQPALQNIALIVESWLTEQLLYAGDSIPILEESPQISAESVMTKLKMALNVFDDLSNVSIQIRAGHVYLLHMIDDEIVISPNHKQFIQDFPLFVNVKIKVQERSAATRNTTCRVLVAVEHVTMKNQSMDEIKDQSSVLAQNKISYNYQLTNGITTIRRTVSSADGQIFYILDEVPTTIYFMESDNARF
ncbi:hypothetical protein F8M41_021700 [Gigaspora margarita]|uniref:Uncharacterized protein n=1 Tax=Gigaspora margarita TaxID=4874 RepID=A0A8H4AGC0_GIGMA|nr:hypothetical protein F8M41_021700 [Gigaspora margarita]